MFYSKPNAFGSTAAVSRGFTLLELLVTLGVAAVLVTVGVPSFVGIVQNNRATTHANALVTALNLARSEATQRGAAVVVCASSDGAACSNDTDWSTGWIVLSPDDDVLRAWPQRDGGTGIITADVDRLQFEARGSVAVAGALFRVRLPNCTTDQGRDLRVNAAGRISVTRVDC